MIKFRYLLASLAGAALIGAVMQPSAAFSLRDLLGSDEEEPAEKNGELVAPSPPAPVGEDQNWAKPAGDTAPTRVQLDFAGVQKILESVDASQRAAVLADETTFNGFVQREADATSLLQAARANKLQQDPTVAFLMQRGSENVLREVYLARLIASKVPQGFPTEEQTRQYFEQNKARLVVPERVQVWQIFLPFEKDMDDKAKAGVSQKADGIVRDLAQNRMTFAEAATRYSRHEPSRLKGGDMGQVPVADLKPEIKQALLALPEGQVGGPLRTDAGVHIVKRGAKSASQPLEYGAIKDQLKPLMLKQAQMQLRKAILDQARKSYPVELDAKKIEELRLRLRTDLAPKEQKQAAAGKS
jgi:peptidylprolyl isomerase